MNGPLSKQIFFLGLFFQMLFAGNTIEQTIQSVEGPDLHDQLGRCRISQRSAVVGQTIGALDVRATTGVTIIAIQRKNQQIRNPGPDLKLQIDKIKDNEIKNLQRQKLNIQNDIRKLQYQLDTSIPAKKQKYKNPTSAKRLNISL